MNTEQTSSAASTPLQNGRSSYVVRHGSTILFVSLALCVAGIYAAYRMPASVFPQTDFPRIVILVDNGVMPADEMMATITRPIEEAMKNAPGTVNIRSATGRGSAEVNVFFDWKTDMIQAELYVLAQLSQIRSSLPDTAEYTVNRLTFSSFPILGFSLTSTTRNITELWEKAEYEIKPRLLRINDVASVNIVGGKKPEYHVVVDPAKLDAHHLTLAQVSDAITQTNTFVSAGLHEENRQLYLTLVDGRVAKAADVEKLPVAWVNGAPVLVGDVAMVVRSEAPKYNIVSADGVDAVLLNVYSQPDGNTVGIAAALHDELRALRKTLPPDMKLALFYDQSLFVREGSRSVWESIGFGLLLSVLVMYLFLRNARTTFVAILAIPMCLLMTLTCMYALGMTFNLMTLGGIAAAIGLIIDDAIVVVEAMHTKMCAGRDLRESIHEVLSEVGHALVGSTITPVVVFLPLAFLEGVPGVFFRALAFTMAASLLISLLLALTLTPALGIALLRRHPGETQDELEQGGFILRRLIRLYERVVRVSLRHPALALMCMAFVLLLGTVLYQRLDSDFLPHMDEGAFVLDYVSPEGTSLTETDRMMRHIEAILRKTPEIESYSRRSGAQLGLAATEPNIGDFLVKLKPDRERDTDEVVDAVREEVEAAEPALEVEFPGVLADLIGDLTWSPEPVEIKIFSSNVESLKTVAPQIAEEIEKIPGVVDVNDGLVVAGPSLTFRVHTADALRSGLTAAQIGDEVESALLGKEASYVLEGDRIVGIRVIMDEKERENERKIQNVPLTSASGPRVTLGEVSDLEHEPGLLEMHREDQRQLIAVSARFSGIDTRSGMKAIQRAIKEHVNLPADVSIEYGGLYQQQQESFANLARVLAMAIFFVLTVLIFEFRTFAHPIAIVIGALLALLGVVGALWVTGTSLNIVSFLGAIIGFGIVAKNGILMLDFVEQLQRRGYSLEEALVQSGRRRLRPVLMTSLTAFLGLLPLAYGIGAGADLLRPLAIGVIGALCVSLVLSLIATPTVYYALMKALHPSRTARNST
ncbi:MAG: efflux RND transporter permease subunit [Candidatus Hydrogenedentes bacterium]|nr:efflux RND transporter permease subunit [Candidatus Hydrogenedentota bacterium]